jgi:hypothetical protein
MPLDLCRHFADGVLLGSLCRHGFTVTYSSTSQSAPLNLITRAVSSIVHFSDQYMFRAKVWPAQVAIHRTVEVDFDIPSMDEERPRSGYKQTHTVRSQAELEMMAAEQQMKTDLQI